MIDIKYDIDIIIYNFAKLFYILYPLDQTYYR